MVKFSVNDCIMGCPDIWLNVISGVSVPVFLNEISIWIGGLGKAVCSPQRGWASCSPPTLLIEGRKNPALPTFFGLLELGHPPSALGAPCSQTVGLKPNYITAFLGRRLADGRSCDLCDPVPYNKSFLVCIYVYVHVTKTNRPHSDGGYG